MSAHLGPYQWVHGTNHGTGWMVSRVHRYTPFESSGSDALYTGSECSGVGRCPYAGHSLTRQFLGGDYQSAVSSPTELIALAPCARSTPEPPTTPGRFNACRRPQDETWPRVKWVVERTGDATEQRHRDEWSSATPEWVATNSQREASWFVTVPFCCRGVPWEGLLCRAVALCCSG